MFPALLRRSFSISYHSVSCLSDFDKDLRPQLRKFCKERILPLAAEVEKKNAFPSQLWREMGDFGLLAPTVDVQYGGTGATYATHCLILEEISRVSGAIGLSYSAHSALCTAQIARWGTSSQKEKYLKKLSSGEFIGALSMSEPNSGSDVMSMKTRAEKKGNKWVINGNKMWITNGPDADVIVCYAKTTPDSGSKRGRISAFIVEKTMPGFSTAQKLDKLGMRGSNTCELIYDNVEVPEENLLGEVNQGGSVLMSGLDYERLVLAAGPVGLMQAAMDVTIPYLQTREQFGKKIGEFQLMQGKVAEMYTKLQSSRAYLYSVARAVDSGVLSNIDCASLILYTSTNATQVALEAIQALGGNGYINDYETGRILRDAKLYEIGAGTNEIRKWLIGRELMKSSGSSD